MTGLKLILAAFMILGGFFLVSSVAFAHCDTLDGPVVNAARRAMDKDNVNYILVWVNPEKEEEIRRAFNKAKEKRNKAVTEKEKEEAEKELYEILVKIHREGEGAPYEGIKPEGSAGPELAIADQAIESKDVEGVLSKISSPHNKEIVKHLFHKLSHKSEYDVNDLRAGREFIEAYVLFVHAVEKALKGEELNIRELHHDH